MGLATVLEVTPGAADSIDFSSFISALTGSITPVQILAVLAAVIGVGMAFFLMWLGVRKAVTAFTSAVSRGKLRI